MEKKTKLQDPKTYWSKLEQEKLGCCPMLFSAYKKFKKEIGCKINIYNLPSMKTSQDKRLTKGLERRKSQIFIEPLVSSGRLLGVGNDRNTTKAYPNAFNGHILFFSIVFGQIFIEKEQFVIEHSLHQGIIKM